MSAETIVMYLVQVMAALILFIWIIETPWLVWLVWKERHDAR